MGLELILAQIVFTGLKAMVDAGKIRRDQTVADALAALEVSEADRDAARDAWRGTLPPNAPPNE